MGSVAIPSGGGGKIIIKEDQFTYNYAGGEQVPTQTRTLPTGRKLIGVSSVSASNGISSPVTVTTDVINNKITTYCPPYNWDARVYWVVKYLYIDDNHKVTKDGTSVIIS